MSQLIARILLSIFVFPLAAILYTVIVVIAMDQLRGNYRFDRDLYAFLTAGICTCAFIGGYWLLLWHKSVNWIQGRAMGTFGAAVASAIVATVVGVMVSGVDRGFGVFVGTVIAPLLWLVATVFIWRESAQERAARLSHAGKDSIVCPTCGYNLTGLKESRCPECGTQFTLDQLLASQPSRTQGEIEG
jgi:hypothetical protein